MDEKDKKCQVIMSDGNPCGRVLHDKKSCFFHSSKEGRSVELFQNELNKIFNNISLKIYDFTGFVFPEGISFPAKIDKDIYFSDAVFQGIANFKKATFKCKVDFIGTTFRDVADFGEISFNAVAFFTVATFENKANFLGVTFPALVSFTGATFQGETTFMHALFKGEADFVASIFQKYTSFHSSFFNGLTRFSGATFGDRVDFRLVTFKDNLVIEGNNKDDKSFSEVEVDFRWVKFLKPEKVSFKKVNLRNFRFLETDLRKVEFIDVDWYREKGKGRNKIYDEVSPDVTKKFDYPLIAQVYKRLRANYEENLNYAEAGDFHIGEMEMRRKGEKKIYNKAVIWAYKLISNYGESYWRPLGWIALLILIFPFLYIVVGITPSYNIDINQNFETLRDYGSSLTYSLSVFSLVRERPYHTINNLGHILTVLESIFSPVLIAFFLLALRRRFKR